MSHLSKIIDIVKMTKREQIVKVLNNYLIQNKQTGGYYSSGVIADEILKALDQPQEEIEEIIYNYNKDRKILDRGVEYGDFFMEVKIN